MEVFHILKINSCAVPKLVEDIVELQTVMKDQVVQNNAVEIELPKAVISPAMQHHV